MLLVVCLGSWISLRRLFMGSRARLGKPVPEELTYAVRAHGNAAEWIPFGILGLLMLELAKAPPYWLHVIGGSYVGLRVLHAFYALNKGPFWIAVIVAVPHYCLLAAMALWAIWLHFH